MVNVGKLQGTASTNLVYTEELISKMNQYFADKHIDDSKHIVNTIKSHLEMTGKQGVDAPVIEAQLLKLVIDNDDIILSIKPTGAMCERLEKAMGMSTLLESFPLFIPLY